MKPTVRVIKVDFGKGMEHVRKIITKDKHIVNSSYIYDTRNTETLHLKDLDKTMQT
jgi:hypothetical protein